MKHRRLDEHVQDFYAQQQLRPEKLNQLMTQAAAASRVKESPARALIAWARRSTTPKIFAVAALLALFITLPLTRWYIADQGDWPLRAAREIALNHNKQLSAEFLAQDYAALRARMSKLDFVLTAPEHMPGAQLRVVGARYCSIQGHLAAQIKLENPQGKHYTLYERSLTDTPTLPSQSEYMVDGVRIQVWREAGLFFGLASSPD